MRIMIIVAAVVLSACTQGTVRPDPPKAAEVLPVYVPTYVPIVEELRRRCEWKRACKPSESIDCAKQRGECLDQYERQLDGIDQVQGNAVPPKSNR